MQKSFYWAVKKSESYFVYVVPEELFRKKMFRLNFAKRILTPQNSTIKFECKKVWTSQSIYYTPHYLFRQKDKQMPQKASISLSFSKFLYDISLLYT